MIEQRLLFLMKHMYVGCRVNPIDPLMGAGYFMFTSNFDVILVHLQGHTKVISFYCFSFSLAIFFFVFRICNFVFGSYEFNLNFSMLNLWIIWNFEVPFY